MLNTKFLYVISGLNFKIPVWKLKSLIFLLLSRNDFICEGAVTLSGLYVDFGHIFYNE